MNVEHACHCTYRIRYHMVFVVKYRKSILFTKEIDFLKDILRQVGERYWFNFEAIGFESDHFHIVVGVAPRYSPSRVMQVIKSITAREFFKKYPDVKKDTMGVELWTDGGHIDTVSQEGNLEKIINYVKEQGRNPKQLKLLDFR